MIEFKKNVKKLLPYNRKEYISRKKWFGVSFQLPGVFEGKDIGLKVFLETYEDWIKNIISKLNNGSNWIVNHDFTDDHWFPNDQNNLKSLRTLFKQNGIPNTFTGALIFSNDDLLKFIKDLISYPYAVINKKGRLYNDLVISHSEIQFAIEISGHLSINLLSTDIELLRKVVNENTSSCFLLYENYGTSL